jgi:hypothetical protein
MTHISLPSAEVWNAQSFTSALLLSEMEWKMNLDGGTILHKLSQGQNKRK